MRLGRGSGEFLTAGANRPGGEPKPRRQRGNLEAILAGVAEERVAGDPRVVDGDTLDFQGVHVRLEGIDAPEYRQYCRDTDGTCYPCGWFSTKALELLVGKAKVECKLSGKDCNGRWLGTCYAKGRNLNGALVEGGFAFAYRRNSERYVPQEDEARREKRALWGVKAVGPWDWRKGERLPECRSPANRIPIEAYPLKADP